MGLSPWNKGLTVENPSVFKNVKALVEARRHWGTSWNKGQSLSLEHRKHLSEVRKGRKPWNKGLTVEDDRVARLVAGLREGRRTSPSPNKGKPLSIEQRKHLSEVSKGKKAWNKGQKNSPEAVKKMKETMSTPAFRERRSQISRALWENPDFVRRVYRGLGKRPTVPEGRLIEILGSYHPEFKYNGDFSLGVTLGGLIPDFVNINGKKEVLEVFSKHFHTGDIRVSLTEEGRKERYAQLGYRCLILWANEIVRGKKEAILEKIVAFQKEA